jgi:taurine dioxygenase
MVMSSTQAFEESRQPSEFRTEALAPAIGAEIIGVDLSAPTSDETFAKVLDCWHRNLVILFRDQHLTEDDQVRFGERFGPPAVSHTRRYTTKNPAVMLISNIRENG